MESITIKKGSEHVINLLQDLQRLNMLEIVSEPNPQKPQIADELWGVLTPEQGADLDNHITEMRKEWDRDI